MAARRRARTDPELSAVVVLRPRGGSPLGESGPITAETISSLLPHPDVVAQAQRLFEDAGFAVSAAGAVEFSVTARRSLFESFFGTRLRLEGVGLAVTAACETGGRELPLGHVPAAIRETLEAVTFGEPPVFGPGGDGP